MEIEVDITRDDYKQFSRYYNTKKNRINLWILLFCVLLFTLDITIRNIIEWNGVIFFITNLFVILVPFWIFMMLIYELMFIIAKYAPSKNGYVLGKRKMVVTEENIIEVAKYRKTIMEWKGVQSIETSKKYIYVFVDKNAGFIIPKRYFSSETESEQFLNFIKEQTIKTKEKDIASSVS